MSAPPVSSNAGPAGEPANDEAENLPFLARVLNHILTPGSSLTPFMWIAFNVIIFFLFCIWLMFVYEMPQNVHVWVFGFLGLGLTLSTNWFMKIVFSSGLDFASQQKEKTEQEDEENVESKQEKELEEKKNE